MEKRDVAIIGSGPAGISAAINAKVRNLSFYFFGNKNLSDKVLKSQELLNITAHKTCSGKEFVDNLHQRLDEMDIELIEEKITAIYKIGKTYSLFVDQKEYQVSSIILCTGVETLKPIENELELLGKGVSYCATCDGNLYKGKEIAIVSDSLENEHEVEYLANLASHVYYFPLFKGSNYKKDNVDTMSTSISKIIGNNYVEAIELKNNEQINVEAVFFLKQAVSPAVLLKGLEMDGCHIQVNRQMETNKKGCFAAGDCTGLPYQIDKAFGEGNVALHSVVKYLSTLK